MVPKQVKTNMFFLATDPDLIFRFLTKYMHSQPLCTPALKSIKPMMKISALEKYNPRYSFLLMVYFNI